MNHDPTKGHFQNIFMTVRGKGGSGKTVLLVTLTSVVRRMFNSKTSVHVGGPTGASACHAGGCTFHRLFNMNTKNSKSNSVSNSTKECLVNEFMDTILLQPDERSMIGSASLARMECVSRHCAHGGFNTQMPWGGIPVVMLHGDDNQLPSMEKGVTFIPLPGHSDVAASLNADKMMLKGNELFLKSAEDVMDLPVIKKQNVEEHKMLDQLDRARNDAVATDVIRHRIDSVRLLSVH